MGNEDDTWKCKECGLDMGPPEERDKDYDNPELIRKMEEDDPTLPVCSENNCDDKRLQENLGSRFPI